MRRFMWIAVGGLVLLTVAIAVSPLRYALFPQPLTANQRAILIRANTGLAVFATKSPTANQFYQEVMRSGRWSRFITVMPTPKNLGGHGQVFSVTVMSKNPMSLVAFYLHPTRTVCFVETACDSLGYLPLGLTYAHELGHRRDFERRLVKISDLPNSRPSMESEARSRLLEETILNEYTAGRFSQAIDRHIQMFRRFATKKQRQHGVDGVTIDVDERWVRQEFGRVSEIDEQNIVQHLLLGALVRTKLAGRKPTTQDSLSVVIDAMEKQ